jgi:Na+/proline symporter
MQRIKPKFLSWKSATAILAIAVIVLSSFVVLYHVSTTNPGTENLNYPTPTPTLNSTINPQPSPIVQIIKQLTGNQSSTTYIIVIAIIISVIAFGLYVSNSNSDSKLKRKMQKQSDWKNPLS